MRRWELWSSSDGTRHALIPEDHPEALEDAGARGLVCTWSTVAKGYNDAMRSMHQHLGWDEYQPMLGDDLTPYPEDDDDRNARLNGWNVRDVQQLLNQAAQAALVARLDSLHSLRFTDDLVLLGELEPHIRFSAGEQPRDPGIVYIAEARERSVLLAARTRSGRGLYIRITCEAGKPPRWEYARDDSAQPATGQTSWVSSWGETTRRRSPQ